MQTAMLRVTGGLMAAAVACFVCASPADAGFFENIFGGLNRAVEAPPPAVPAYAEPIKHEPFSAPIAAPAAPQRHVENGPASAFCVRSCDGHFFPVKAHPGLSVAQACHAFCPASETRVYSGSNIDYAVAGDGSRYRDLPNAFAYRRQIVAGCTCNGRDPFGLAQIDPKSDPTLKPGDVVATKAGLQAFTGKSAEFTPVQDYSGFAKVYRAQLAALKMMPANPGAPPAIISPILPATVAARAEDSRRADLGR